MDNHISHDSIVFSMNFEGLTKREECSQYHLDIGGESSVTVVSEICQAQGVGTSHRHRHVLLYLVLLETHFPTYCIGEQKPHG